LSRSNFNWAGTYGVYTGQKSNIVIKNCNLINYGGSIRIHGGGNILIQDNNLSRSSGRSASGIQITGTTTDVNVVDNIIHNRGRAIEFTVGGTTTTNLSFLRNDFNTIYNGFYGPNQIFNNLKISDNNFFQASNYVLEFHGADNITFSDTVDANITSDNNFYLASSVIYCGSNCRVENIDFNQWVISGTMITFNETGLDVINNNISKPSGGQTGIKLMNNSSDINVYGNTSHNINYPFSCTNYSTYDNISITNNDFNNNYANTINCISNFITNLTIADNNLTHLKAAYPAINLPQTDNLLVDNSTDANIRNNNFTGSYTIAMNLDSNNIVRNLNLAQYGYLSGGIQFNGSNNQVYDTNISSSKPVRFIGSGSDNNISNNYFNGSYPFSIADNLTQTRLLINNNIFTGVYFGININRVHLIDSNITYNNFGSLLSPIYQPDTSSHTNTRINFNDFINTSNVGYLQVFPGADWNGNYWGNLFSCTDTSPDDGICDDLYSFDGGNGIDYVPRESPIN
jgi:hypothetical protein